MPFTYLEIKFDEKVYADLEERADEADTDVPTLINILCGIYLKS